MASHHLITSHRVAKTSAANQEDARHFTITNTLKLDARAER